jgi:serine phosphatase RsbU (regulator of sigma subunit)
MSPVNVSAPAWPLGGHSGSGPETPPARPVADGVSPAPPGSREHDFDTYRNGLIHKWNATLSAMGAVIIAASALLDPVILPREHLTRLLVYRLITVLALVVSYRLIRAGQPSRYSFLQSYGLSFLAFGMVVLFTRELGGFNSHYYASLNLVVMAANLMLPWRPRHCAINGLLACVMYLGVNSLGGGEFEIGTALKNLYYIVTTTVLTMVIKGRHYRLLQQEFEARTDLISTNAQLDRSRQEYKEARDALWGEMEVAKRIQTALLPTVRTLGPYEVASVMQTAAEVGGDYYDLFETAAGERWVCIGDVSGHGVESGLVMMMTQTSILTTVTAQPGLRPSQVFSTVNEVLWDNISRLKTNRYMTLNVIRLESDELVVAGKHQDILVYRAATRQVETVVNEGCWIGMLKKANQAVEDLRIPVQPNDLILLFTDGLTEAISTSGEMYGQERLAASLAAAAELPLEKIVDRLLSEVRDFAEKQDDDMTVILLRRMAPK